MFENFSFTYLTMLILVYFALIDLISTYQILTFSLY
jgi:hypothetical protein